MALRDEIAYRIRVIGGQQVIQEVQRTGRSFDMMDKSAQRASQGVGMLNTRFNGLAQLLTGGTFALLSRRMLEFSKNVAGGIVNTVSDFQVMFKRASLGMKGRSDELRVAFKDIEKFAVRTPFEMKPSLELMTTLLQFTGDVAIETMGIWGEMPGVMAGASKDMKANMTTMLMDLASARGALGERFGGFTQSIQLALARGGKGRSFMSLMGFVGADAAKALLKGMSSEFSFSENAKVMRANLLGFLSSNQLIGASEKMGANIRTRIRNFSDFRDSLIKNIFQPMEEGATATRKLDDSIKGLQDAMEEVTKDKQFVASIRDITVFAVSGIEKIIKLSSSVTKWVGNIAKTRPGLIKLAGGIAIFVTGLITLTGIVFKLGGTYLIMRGLLKSIPDVARMSFSRVRNQMRMTQVQATSLSGTMRTIAPGVGVGTGGGVHNIGGMRRGGLRGGGRGMMGMMLPFAILGGIGAIRGALNSSKSEKDILKSYIQDNPSREIKKLAEVRNIEAGNMGLVASAEMKRTAGILKIKRAKASQLLAVEKTYKDEIKLLSSSLSHDSVMSKGETAMRIGSLPLMMIGSGVYSQGLNQYRKFAHVKGTTELAPRTSHLTAMKRGTASLARGGLAKGLGKNFARGGGGMALAMSAFMEATDVISGQQSLKEGAVGLGGSAIGALVGGALGSIVAPGIGTVIGTQLGATGGGALAHYLFRKSEEENNTNIFGKIKNKSVQDKNKLLDALSAGRITGTELLRAQVSGLSDIKRAMTMSQASALYNIAGGTLRDTDAVKLSTKGTPIVTDLVKGKNYDPYVETSLFGNQFGGYSKPFSINETRSALENQIGNDVSFGEIPLKQTSRHNVVSVHIGKVETKDAKDFSQKLSKEMAVYAFESETTKMEEL